MIVKYKVSIVKVCNNELMMDSTIAHVLYHAFDKTTIIDKCPI